MNIKNKFCETYQNTESHFITDVFIEQTTSVE